MSGISELTLFFPGPATGQISLVIELEILWKGFCFSLKYANLQG